MPSFFASASDSALQALAGGALAETVADADAPAQRQTVRRAPRTSHRGWRPGGNGGRRWVRSTKRMAEEEEEDEGRTAEMR